MKKILISFFSFILLINYSYAFDPKGKTVNVVIPFAPGGGVDNSFKHLQKYASDKGINLVPTFKAGAEGTLGIKEVVEGPKSGLQLGLTTAGSLALYEIRNPENFKVKYISGLRTTVQVFATHPNSGIKNWKDLERSINSNKSINVGIGNPGQRLVWNQVLELLNIQKNPVFVPYKGASDVLRDITGGHIDVTYLPITVLKGNIDSGQLIPLAVTSIQIEEWPNAPLINTIIKNWKDLEFGHILFVAENTDLEAIKYWSDFIREYLNDANTKEEFRKTNSVQVKFGEATAREAIRNIKPGMNKVYTQ